MEESSDTAPRRRKSLSQSIRARLSRPVSRDSTYNHPPPPLPPLPISRARSADSIFGRPPNPASSAPISMADLDTAWSSITPPAFPVPLQYAACYCEENVYMLAQHLASQLTRANRAAINIAQSQKQPAPGQALFVPVWDVHVLFISNAGKTVLLYQQAASKLPSAGSPVIWDYHVVAAVTAHLVPLHQLAVESDATIARPPVFGDGDGWSRTWIYDPDSRLARTAVTAEGGELLRPVPKHEYDDKTFRPGDIAAGVIPPHFQPAFRYIAANDFLARFASDRSHMLQDGPVGSGGKVWSAPPPAWDPIVGAKAAKLGVSNNLMRCYVDMAASEAGFGTVVHAGTWLGCQSVPCSSLGATIRDALAVEAASSSQRATPASLARDSRWLAPPSTARPAAAKGDASNGAARGGRIASPLFPAYLHASQQHRSRPPPPPPTH
ncbi:hypothetical protein PANT_7d00081 [Moesziomyces antarcticus T-34]|uniref:Protein N-terminal glutamine amidohydrolase n=1 Tax=Pseudozyma antarctica (strain T-34) TaxID=1151754 RepID=M9LYW6_PSEA3|nr:hypothetical protein PANT_7d00081 [Moesziomyces antarcticus T-34]